jgi:ankyrin repeat protein
MSGFYGSSLQAASVKGDESIVRILLDYGADVNTIGGYYGSSLQAASAEGDESIVRILLDHGADVNALGGKHGNALNAALWAEHEGTVLMLLEAGAVPDSESLDELARLGIEHKSVVAETSGSAGEEVVVPVD